MIEFTVYGRPRPKGSVEPVPMAGGRAKVRHRNENWQTLVAKVAQDHVDGPIWDGPVGVALTVLLAKPASAPKRRRVFPVRRSGLDIDKACRAVLDALTGVVFGDDSQVCFLNARKDWADDGRPRIEVTCWQYGEHVPLEVLFGPPDFTDREEAPAVEQRPLPL